MKKIFQTLLLLCMLTSVAFAQKRTTGSQAITEDAKMQTIRSCPDLQQQLITLFGENFKLDNPKVIAQIQKNITNENASACIRKNSLYVVYGEKYTEHLNLISNQTTK